MSESVKLWVCLIDCELMFRSFFYLALPAGGGGEGLNKDLIVGLDGARTTPISYYVFDKCSVWPTLQNFQARLEPTQVYLCTELYAKCNLLTFPTNSLRVTFFILTSLQDCSIITNMKCLEKKTFKIICSLFSLNHFTN